MPDAGLTAPAPVALRPALHLTRAIVKACKAAIQRQ